MRHNAFIEIIYHNGEAPLSFYIASHGQTDTVRTIIRQALSKQYTLVKHNPELAAVNIFHRFGKHTDTYITQQDKQYLITYLLNISSNPPRITIKHNTNELSETVNLFSFIGGQNKVTAPPAEIYVKETRRRGRPTRLSYLKEPVPDKYLNKSNTIINFTGVENYASGIDDSDQEY